LTLKRARGEISSSRAQSDSLEVGSDLRPRIAESPEPGLAESAPALPELPTMLIPPPDLGKLSSSIILAAFVSLCFSARASRAKSQETLAGPIGPNPARSAAATSWVLGFSTRPVRQLRSRTRTPEFLAAKGFELSVLPQASKCYLPITSFLQLECAEKCRQLVPMGYVLRKVSNCGPPPWNQTGQRCSHDLTSLAPRC
jgi:hypothetical protein